MKNVKRNLSRGIAAVVLAGSAVGLTGTLAGTAGADPAYSSASGHMVGVGSDTIQDVFDAYTGANPYPPSAAAKFYVPLHSGTTGNNSQVSSFDAIPAGGSTAAPGCITTKIGGPTFDRPDGSGAGRNALLATLGTTGWKNPTASKSCTGVNVNVQGQIDFARSSSLSTTGGTTLTYIPFGRDALSYAFYVKGGGTVTGLDNLTQTQLTTLYSSASGTITVDGHTVRACTVNSQSGTRQSFDQKVGLSAAVTSAAAAASGCPSEPEEHGGNAFYTLTQQSWLANGEAAVIPFSATQWVCQNNGFCTDRSNTARANGVDVGDVNGVSPGPPYSGSPPNQTIDTDYVASSWGRDVYVVVLTSKIGSGLGASQGLIGLFKGAGAAICNTENQQTREKFGLGVPSLACGDFSLQRGA